MNDHNKIIKLEVNNENHEEENPNKDSEKQSSKKRFDVTKFLVKFGPHFAVLGVIIIILLISSAQKFQIQKKSDTIPTLSPTQELIPTNTPTIITNSPTKSAIKLPSPTISKVATITNTVSLSPTSGVKDTEPPTSYFLTADGSGDIKASRNSDGLSCVSFSPPKDNITPPEQIDSHYRFDGGQWSAYQKILASACYNLTPGQHIIEVQSKDAAENEEAPKKSTVTVE